MGVFDAMGALSIWHILAVVVVVALLFGGRGRISGIMGDTAKGIKAFKEGLKGVTEDAKNDAHIVTPAPADTSAAAKEPVAK